MHALRPIFGNKTRTVLLKQRTFSYNSKNSPKFSTLKAMKMDINFSKLKEDGNCFFRNEEFKKAVDCYLLALKCTENINDENRLAIYKNLAAAHLKLNDYSEALNYASKATDINPMDVKALFRRMQAFEGLNMNNEAFKDAILVKKLEPKNKAVESTLQKLSAIVQKSSNEQTSLQFRVNSMIDFLKSENSDNDKLCQAANNLLVLAKETAGTDFIMKLNGIEVIKNLLISTKLAEMKLTLIRVLSEISKHKPDWAVAVLKQIGLPFLLDTMEKNGKDREELLTSVQYTIQVIINTLTGLNLKDNVKPNKELMNKFGPEIDELMQTLLRKSSSRTISGVVRDTILELISRNVDFDALNMGKQILENDCLRYLLDVSSQLEEHRYESSMEITRNTRFQIAMTLERVYGCLDHDKAREEYVSQVKQFLQSKLMQPDSESKVEAVATITALLYGPTDVGNQCLAQQGIVEMMLVMAGAEDDELQQRVAAEAIIAAASKKDKCTSIATLGSNVLKKLYKSSNENIKVRALVGMCKIGSVGGTDASFRLLSDVSVSKLLTSCKKYLLSPSKDNDLRKWASEGLAYLSLDADVKEDIASDNKTLSTLVELAKSGDFSFLYGTINTFVNLTNSYDKQEILPEMLELAKFAKQHIPEDHIKDKPEYIEKRCRALAKMNISSALVSSSKTESKTTREMISRIFNAICQYQDLRGVVVQQGGTKALLTLSKVNNTEKGKIHASQALGRIGITINPEVAFPGQRSVEVVRPLMSLLHYDCSSLQNFEGLMALTNLAQVSVAVQTQILKDSGFSKIEHFMFEDHDLLRRAAVQCASNLITNEIVVSAYEGNNDRVKFLVVLCEDDDILTAKAASGALAMLTSVSSKACQKIFDAKRWFEILLMLVSSKDTELQHRGVYIVNNLIHSSKDISERIVDTNILEVFMAIIRPEVDDVAENIKLLAKEALKKLEEYELIKSTENCGLTTITE